MSGTFTAIALEILILVSYVGISLEPIRQLQQTINQEQIK